MFKRVIEPCILSDDQGERLMKPSGYHCPECAEPMCLAEHEVGLCVDCYQDTVGDY